MKVFKKGFAHIFIIILAIVIIAVVLIAYGKNNNHTTNKNNIRLSPVVNGNPSCVNTGRVTLTEPLINPTDLKAIWPLGRTANDHVTPTDHQYYIVSDVAKKNGGAVVRAPADGVIFGISFTDYIKIEPRVTAAERYKYSVALAFNCNLATTFYISEVAPELKPYVSTDNTVSKPINIPVQAGQLLGKVTGGADVWMIDTNSKLSGFADAGDYMDEPWKLYSHSLADYYGPTLRDAYNAKSLRQVKPFGGKIDYDQPGRLVGNWFKQGILPSYMQQPDFWRNELAIFYDYIEPTQIRIMIGQLAKDKPGNFGFDVIGNTPDPATVSVASGIIKYALVDYTYADEQDRDLNQLGINIDDMSADKKWHVKDEKTAWGVALIQMIEARKIKLEIFPGKTAAQVTDFTDKSQIYER